MEKLAHPPIEQAAIEVIVTPPQVDFADLDKVVAALAADYPKKTDIRRQAIQVQLAHADGPQGQFEDLGQFGWQLFSNDGRRGIQVRTDGVLLTQRGEYEDWESCYEDFHKAVVTYFEALKPERVRRASSRFINKLELKPGVAIEDLIKVPLPMPTGFDDVKIANMASRISFQDPETGLQGTLILMADGAQPALILDIDVADLEPGPLSATDLKDRFDRLREFKNRIFRQSLTDKQLEVYR